MTDQAPPAGNPEAARVQNPVPATPESAEEVSARDAVR